MTSRPSALPGLSVVLPCHDDEANVADAIRTAAAAAARVAADYEILVVDDGSTDGTAKAASRFVDGAGHVRLLVHPHNRGYGSAVRTGLESASMPWVLLTDADLQFDLRDLEDFAMLARSADLIAGRRVLRQDPLSRRVCGALWSALVRRMFRLPVRDVDCAFKLIRRELLDGIELSSTGGMISAELLVRCLARGGRLIEHGVRHRPRLGGRRSGARPAVVLHALNELAREQRELRRLARTYEPSARNATSAPTPRRPARTGGRVA
jgi:glycosyltransferase involved in cell wall biosynthesis